VEPFEAFEFLDFLRQKWRIMAGACVVAVILSTAVSLMLPKRYTAMASIVIEPPGGNDVRTATAVSPVYLESLKTYERFAASDTLFARAVKRFHLDEEGGRSIESLKRQVLKVSKLRDTKILEISATLTDPKLAQGFVQFLAEETVTMSREESMASDRELIEEAGKQLADTEIRLKKARSVWTDIAAREPTESLLTEIEASTEVLTKLRQELTAAEADTADYQERDKAPTASGDRDFGKQQLAATRARVELLQRRRTEMERDIAAKSTMAAERSAHRDGLAMDLKTAQADYDAAVSRLRDLKGSAGTRGERLRVIDPGIVPQRPTSPNVPLNVLTALMAALMATLFYVSVSFAYRHKAIKPFHETSHQTISKR
jgi:succinoglycan biosynthesis transport protein ExoP